MDALKLLKTWPGWTQAGTEMILASPAWRMPIQLGEESGMMRFGNGTLADTINLNIMLNDEPHILSLADSSGYPDLHLLWHKRNDLPSEIILALLERECGDVFSLLEKSLRCLVRIRGLASAPAPAAPNRFLTVETSTRQISFALDLSAEYRTLWGRLDYIDPSHPSIRNQMRTARVDYCSLMLTEDECRTMTRGDHLLVPESFDGTQTWIVETSQDEALHLCSSDTQEISFGAFVDETFPAIPPASSNLILVLKDKVLQKCSLARVGMARTIQIS